MLAMILLNKILENLTYDVGYIFDMYIIHLLLVCISKLKYYERQDDITYNVVYLSFIDEE